VSLAAYDGTPLLYRALEVTKADTDGTKLVEAMKGMNWESPHGPVTIERLATPCHRDLSARLATYERSFVFGADLPSDQDRAALISATGWCSGWRPLLGLLGNLTAQ
jgi:hypothetical protein